MMCALSQLLFIQKHPTACIGVNEYLTHAGKIPTSDNRPAYYALIVFFCCILLLDVLINIQLSIGVTNDVTN